MRLPVHSGSPRARVGQGVAPVLLGAVLLLCQLVLGPQIDVAGAAPNFMLVLAAALAFMGGPSAGTVAGFACGLVFDLAGTGPVGLSSLLGCVAGYLLGHARHNVLADGWRRPLATFAVASLAYNAAYLAALFALSTTMDLSLAVALRLVAATALDVLVALPSFAAMARASAAQSVGSGGFHLS